jgi:hypothetical protein
MNALLLCQLSPCLFGVALMIIIQQRLFMNRFVRRLDSIVVILFRRSQQWLCGSFL